VRPVETGPEINAVIVTLGVFVGFIALAAILFGNTVQSFPAPFALRGISVGEVNVAITPNDIYRLIAVLIAMGLCWRCSASPTWACSCAPPPSARRSPACWASG
jgi:branched-chain amino acid transport system permease protein